jgi:hypothetical protein
MKPRSASCDWTEPGMRLLTAGGAEHNRLTRWTSDGAAVMVTLNQLRADRLDAYLVGPRPAVSPGYRMR